MNALRNIGRSRWQWSLKPLLAALLASALVPVSASAAAAARVATPVSFFPQRDLGKFLAENFDLASLRSSFGPRRTADKRTFADFGLVATRSGDDILEFDDERWFYQLRVLRRADINNDGVEDLEVCFTDRAKGGAIDTRKALLISRYSDETYAVALNFEVDSCALPKPKAKAR